MEIIAPPRVEHRQERPYVGIRVVTPFRGMLKVRDELLREVRAWIEESDVDPIEHGFLRLHVIDTARLEHPWHCFPTTARAKAAAHDMANFAGLPSGLVGITVRVDNVVFFVGSQKIVRRFTLPEAVRRALAFFKR